MKSRWLDFWIRSHLFFLPFGSLNFGNPYFSINFITAIVIILSVNFKLVKLFTLKNEIGKISSFLLIYLVYFVAVSLLFYKKGTDTGSSEIRMQTLYIFSFFSLLYYFYLKPQRIYYIKKYLIYGIVVLIFLALINIGVEVIGRYGRIRIFGMNPNYVSFFIIIFIMFVVNDLFERSTRSSVIKNLILLIIGLAIFIRLGSLNNLVALMAALAVYFLMKGRRLSKRVRFLILGFIVFVPIFYYVFNSGIYSERLGDTESLKNLSGRRELWKTGLEMAKNNLVFGRGVYEPSYIKRTVLGTEISFHNVYLDLLIYTGSIGLFIFLTFVFRTVKRLYLISKLYQNSIFLSFGIIPLINIVSGQFSFLFYTYLLFVAIPIEEYRLLQ